jgi:hypothetical protein
MRHKRQLLFASGLFGLVVASAAVQQYSFVGIDEVVRVREVLKSPGLPAVRVLGVCEVSPDGATCWDGKGKPLRWIGERITAYYGEQNSATVAIRPKVKNRWVVIEREEVTPKSSFSFSEWTSSRRAGVVSSLTAGKVLEWYRLDAEKYDVVASFDVLLRKELPVADVMLRQGERVEVDGMKLTLSDFGKIDGKRLETDHCGIIAPTIKYRMLFKKTGGDAERKHYTVPTLIDSVGQAIRYVAEDGKPPPRSNGISFNSRNDVCTTINLTRAGEVEYRTNVDPSIVARLMFSPRENIQVVFEQIPLDPITGSGE